MASVKSTDMKKSVEPIHQPLEKKIEDAQRRALEQLIHKHSTKSDGESAGSVKAPKSKTEVWER